MGEKRVGRSGEILVLCNSGFFAGSDVRMAD